MPVSLQQKAFFAACHEKDILILLHGPDPRKCLAALGDAELPPLVAVFWQANLVSPDIKEEACALGTQQQLEGRLNAFIWQELAQGQEWRHAANELILSLGRQNNASRPKYLFLLSSSVLPERHCLAALRQRLETEPNLAGVSPLLLSPRKQDAFRRVWHMGSVFDSRNQLHALYEGLPLDHPLVQKRRLFQVAHEDALMLRLNDFCSIGGFSDYLDELALLDLCLRLGAGLQAFSTEPTAQATLANILAGLNSAGCWNSLVQRGRIAKNAVKPDYHLHVLADGLEYSFTSWLEEGPTLEDNTAAEDTWTNAWLAWRHTQEPAKLLQLLACSDSDLLKSIFRHVRAFPSMLPHSFSWYLTQICHMEKFAEREELSHFKEKTVHWLKFRTRFHHHLLRPGLRTLAEAGIWSCSLDAAPSSYDAWQELREPLLTVNHMETGQEWPDIAVLMPVFNPRPEHLAAALDSVLAQSYSRWQLCVADDASTNPAIPQLLSTYAAKDPRIRLLIRQENGHISRATNSALDLADAPWTAFFDHDDLLAATALQETAAVIAARPEVRCIYTDEDKIDENGVRRTPIFKPDFDYDLNIMGHLTTCARDLVKAVGALRSGLEGSQDFDLSLRITEKLEPHMVAHIPRVLYHWRIHEESTAGSLAAKPYVLEATQRALAESAQRRGYTVEGAASCQNNFFKLILGTPAGLKCSIVLLADARCRTNGIAPALMSALEGISTQMWTEILWQPLAAESVIPPAWISKMLPAPSLLPFAGSHWTSACLAASRKAQGNIVLFLHAGLKPAYDCRAEQLPILAMRNDLALVGGLVWKQGTLWNGGYAPDVTGLPFPLLRGAAPENLKTLCWSQFLLPRHAIGLAWQCMAIRKELLLEPQALDPGMGSLAVVDYSLRQEKKGRFTLVSPWGQWELPPDSENDQFSQEMIARFLARWGETVCKHGLRNPNLCAASDYGWRLILDDSKKAHQ